MKGTSKAKGKKLKGRLAFYTKLTAIREALDAGMHRTAIYDQHAAGLGIGYSQFCKHVQRHITAKDNNADGRGKTIGASTKARSRGTKAASASQPRSAGPRDLPTFQYDPLDAYRTRK